MSLKYFMSVASSLFLLVPGSAFADDCRAPGNMIFLGTTPSQAQSVWLSATGAGAFTLKAGPNNLAVDQFDKARRGLHVSLSPVVAGGDLGAHTLVNNGGCVIGTTATQVGGLDFSRRVHLLNGDAQRLPPGLLGRIQSRLPESFRKKAEPEPTSRAASAPASDSGNGGDNSGSGNNGNGDGTNCGNCQGNNGNGNGNGGSNPDPTVPPPVVPITPEVPVAPVAPVQPLPPSPPTPVTPITPEVPVAPVAPVQPLPPSPPTPVTPITPEVPVAPVAPVQPLPPSPPTPVTPITPEVPVAPVAPVQPLPPSPPTPITPEVPVAPVAPVQPLPPTPVTPVTPTVPVAPVAPVQPLPPTPVRPVTPTVPVAPAPPIGTLPPTRPPTGVTPGVPVVPTPPIGTLPPGSGTTPITPTVPTVPTRPGAVTPPIGTLPPGSGTTPITPTVPTVPTRPGAVTPPIGTLPPTTGVTPGMPVAPAPPIGTLPPAPPTTPTTPGAPAPPTGTRPPTTGVTPGAPGGVPAPVDPAAPPVTPTPTRPIGPGVVTPPVGVLPPEPPTTGRPPVTPITPARPGVDVPNPGARRVDGTVPPTAVLPCPDPDPAHHDPRRPIDCPDPQQLAMAAGATDTGAQEVGQRPFGGQAPITPGRQFGDEPRWDVWFATGPYGDSFDTRYELDLRSRSEFANVGIDRLFGDNVVFGVNANVERNQTDGFSDTWAVHTDGYTVGPHLGYRFSESWTLDASASAGWFDNTMQLDMLSGTFGSQRYTGALNFNGQYSAGHTNFRPKVGASYTNAPSNAYTLAGASAGGPVALSLAASVVEYGDATAALEITHGFGRSGSLFVPYLEMGARYEYLRANGGQMLAGDLTMVTPSPWSGTVRAGARTLISGSTFLELGGGYLSFGQRGLATWETRVFLSQGF